MTSDDDRYLRFDLFSDDRDVEIRMQSARVVTTKAPHPCISPIGKDHQIPKKTKARFEKAIVEGVWRRYWTCLPCIDAFDEPPYTYV